MMNAVEEDEFDIQRGVQSVWAIAFGILYLMVMVTSIILYMLTIRAVAKNGRRENVTYFLIFFLFFAALVEFALIIEGKSSSFLTQSISIYRVSLNKESLLAFSIACFRLD